MSQKVTIGGDRVGSGKKMQAELHDYYRSTHNLSEKWASSMASGVLYPAMCKLAMRGDTFDIDINADARTIPTVAPLFGSYKMQIDVYQCPVRLYQGILHNNPLAIGLNMAQVKFPILKVMTAAMDTDGNQYDGHFANNSLLTYLGMRGLGHCASSPGYPDYGRIINALPALSYYDIFKTYYANKQEEKAYVITPTEISYAPVEYKYLQILPNGLPIQTIANYENNTEINLGGLPDAVLLHFIIKNVPSEATDTDAHAEYFIKNNVSINEIIFQNFTDASINFTRKNNELEIYYNIADWDGDVAETYVKIDTVFQGGIEEYDIQLSSFDLTNIDDMRYDLLSHHTLGTPFEIKERNADDPLKPKLPYSALISINESTGRTYNAFQMNGLVLKTYQNDMFNNWLNSDWIEGENGINELTKVAVVDGAFSMDALNMSMKLYNMLNRIALAGGTYEDWQDVVYEEVQRRQIESPIYVGGMSQEIMFDEIIQTTPTEGSPLGTLGGRGALHGNKKGGRIHVKCDEACFIIAIISLTPRIMYTQGNEFYMTDVYSMDDLHKPAMDGIGFQDLIGERLAYWDTVIAPEGTTVLHRSKIGKLPAWIEYMTSYDRAYGDFAGEEGKGFMTLNRNYEKSNALGIKDATTYIDPSKYNYAFAVKELYANNFWVEIQFNIKARRLMSARLIPNV